MTRLIWRGSGKNLELAATMACQGIAESHYILPAIYDKYRGFFGMHNGTLLAEVKRLHRGGSKAMWLAWSKRDPIGVSYFSASRLAYLKRCYGSTDSAIKCWVAGEGWIKGTRGYNAKDAKKARLYLRTVTEIRDKCFSLGVWE